MTFKLLVYYVFKLISTTSKICIFISIGIFIWVGNKCNNLVEITLINNNIIIFLTGIVQLLFKFIPAWMLFYDITLFLYHDHLQTNKTGKPLKNINLKIMCWTVTRIIYQTVFISINTAGFQHQFMAGQCLTLCNVCTKLPIHLACLLAFLTVFLLFPSHRTEISKALV